MWWSHVVMEYVGVGGGGLYNESSCRRARFSAIFPFFSYSNLGGSMKGYNDGVCNSRVYDFSP